MTKVSKGDWVKIRNTVLPPSARAPQLPQDTKQVPLDIWLKGFVQDDAEIGDEVEITTITGRTASGTLVEHNPYYGHDYGKCLPELLQIGLQAKAIVFGTGDRHD